MALGSSGRLRNLATCLRACSKVEDSAAPNLSKRPACSTKIPRPMVKCQAVSIIKANIEGLVPL